MTLQMTEVFGVLGRLNNKSKVNGQALMTNISTTRRLLGLGSFGELGLLTDRAIVNLMGNKEELGKPVAVLFLIMVSQRWLLG